MNLSIMMTLDSTLPPNLPTLNIPQKSWEKLWLLTIPLLYQDYKINYLMFLSDLKDPKKKNKDKNLSNP